MKNSHFYKAQCRLGLINIPFGSTEWNTGVECGPEAILTDKFLHYFNSPSVISYKFSLPENINKNYYRNVIATEYNEFAHIINTTLQPEETQVVIGGDHSISFSSYLALQKRVQMKDVAYIQFDSHADIHSFETSPSGNFHGMYVRAFTEDIGDPPLQSLVTQLLPTNNMMYIGNLVMEEEERIFINDHKIKIISRQDIKNSKKKVIEKLRKFLKLFKHVHVTFDIDVFDKNVVQATGILAENGLFPDDIFPLLEIISVQPSLSVDLVEVNPKKSRAKETIKLAQDILTALLL